MGRLGGTVVVLLAWAVSGCSVTSTTNEASGAGGAGGSAGSTGGTGAASQDNLLVNSSFESWSEGEPFSWEQGEGVVRWEQSTEDPAEGAATLRIEASQYGSLHQDVVPVTAWPAGTKFVSGGKARYVTGDDAPAFVEVRLRYSDETDDADTRAFSSLAPGVWSSGTAIFQAEKEVAWVSVSLHLGQGEQLQTLDFDDTYLRVE